MTLELVRRTRSLRRIEVVRSSELRTGYSTQGIVREKAFESKNIVVSRTRVPAGAKSDWHHHGARHLYAYMVSGRIKLECGLKGTNVVEARPGDFFHIPPRLVHRDVNPDRKHELVVVNILAGRGVPVVNVGRPEEDK
jgi:uncharacterized RmlC-like cupin family protein